MSCCPISVLVTGANRGIGLEMVKQLVETHGHGLRKLFATCRNPDQAEELKCLADSHKGVIKIIKMDASDEGSIKRAAKEVGPDVEENGLNLIINNAAVAPYSNFMACTVDELHSCFNTNVIGPVCIVKAFHPYLKTAAQKSSIKGLSCSKAAVVNISTIVSSIGTCKESYKQFPGAVAYRASKAALNMAMVCGSVELEQEGILCGLLHPGWVRTALGGPDGEIEACESVKMMLQVMKKMNEKYCGVLMDYNDKNIPW